MENTGNPLFMGIDSSTQSCKVICINTATNKIDYLDSVNYDQDLPQYNTRNGAIRTDDKSLSESDPQMWIDALEMLFSRMKDEGFPLADIRAISVSGQQHGLVSLDEAGNLTRQRSKLWNDSSTVEECEILTEKLGGSEKMIEEVGNTQRAGYTAGKIFHMYRHEPEAAQKSSTFFLVHNYINFFLSGGVRVMEPGDTSGIALRHPGAAEWSKAVCDLISEDLIQKLPPVKPSDEMIATISPALAEKYGFSPDCQIDAGSGDNMYGAIGTGNIEPGIVTVSLGTSGTAYTVFDEPYIDPDGEIAAFADSTGRYLPLLCVNNMANGYNQILEQYDISHAEFTDILTQTPLGNDGKLLFPWYEGERTPDLPNATPVYWGFGLNDFNKSTLCRAVLEGHVLNMYDGFKKMPAIASEIRLTGGLSQSEAWCQTIADIFEMDTVPIEGEGAALGAALHAAWVYFKQNDTGFNLKSLTDAFVKVDETRRKHPENAAIYRKSKAAYHEISQRLRNSVGSVDPFKVLGNN